MTLSADDAARIVALGDLEPGASGDCFALLAVKQRATTRDGKPYYRVTFRDRLRAATAMIWHDSPLFAECERDWCTGRCYKLRCRYLESQYGPQLDLERIRETNDGDAQAGFDESEFFESSRFHPEEMYGELLELVDAHVADAPLRDLVRGILEEHGEAIRIFPAASRNHHAFRSGFLEHVLSVTRTALSLAEKYAGHYPEMHPPLDVGLVVAGAVLHDIGKLWELDAQPAGADYTARGTLVGHVLLGRDLVRDKAAEMGTIDDETLLRLEHVILAHQGAPEHGSPVQPHTPEALLVHYADEIDARFQMMARALEHPPHDGEEFTGRENPLRRPIFRGLAR